MSNELVLLISDIFILNRIIWYVKFYDMLNSYGNPHSYMYNYVMALTVNSNKIHSEQNPLYTNWQKT